MDIYKNTQKICVWLILIGGELWKDCMREFGDFLERKSMKSQNVKIFF